MAPFANRGPNRFSTILFGLCGFCELCGNAILSLYLGEIGGGDPLPSGIHTKYVRIDPYQEVAKAARIDAVGGAKSGHGGAGIAGGGSCLARIGPGRRRRGNLAGEGR